MWAGGFDPTKLKKDGAKRPQQPPHPRFPPNLTFQLIKIRSYCLWPVFVPNVHDSAIICNLEIEFGKYQLTGT